MTTPTSTAEAPTRPRTPRGSLVVLATLVVLWLLWGVAWLVAPDRNPGGQCEGLGFGCTLTPHDSVAFAGIIVVAPSTVLALAVTLVVRLVRISRGSPRTVWDVIVGALLVLGFGVWLVGTVAGAV
ncbi:hypothetical protein ACOCJ5_12485 [Knoellia sp. CPCC 206450]|uniref:hypothetical protein n=1 Tax=Knoellia tibetensis TaxID=3404798 RepID=UPI003B42C479